MVNQANNKLKTNETIHLSVMKAILKALIDTPLVLKGGTALLVCYGLDRFSEDLDFDSPIKLNIENKIKKALQLSHVNIENFDIVKDTSTVSRIRIRYSVEHVKRSLKIEISYRTPAESNHLII